MIMDCCCLLLCVFSTKNEHVTARRVSHTALISCSSVFVLLLCLFCILHVVIHLLFSSFAVGKVENVLIWCLHGRTHCCIATFLTSPCTVAVVDSNITKVRGNFVEDEYYHTVTEFQESSLRPDISGTCT